MSFRAVFGLGMVLMALAGTAGRVLGLLFWSRMRHVNPSLWQARHQSQSATTPLSKLRFGWTLTAFFFWKEKTGWERIYGSIDDVVLDRLSAAGKRATIAFLALWFGLVVAAVVEKACRALSSF